LDIGAKIFKNDEVSEIQIPQIETLNFIPVETKYKKVLTLNWIISIVASIGLFFFFLRIFSKSSIYDYLPYFFGAVLFVLTTVFILNLIGFKKRKYAVRDKDISYKKGLIATKLTTVPFNRVQHIDVSQGFFSKRLGLAKLTVYTAGESGGDLSIKGLTLQKANDLREFITAKVNV